MYMVAILYSNDEATLCGRFLGEVEQVRVALVADGHNTKNIHLSSAPKKNLRVNSPNTEKLSGSCAEGDIGTSEVVDSGF